MTGVTWPQVVTALVAGAAFVLSLVSLTLQFNVWRHSGLALKVKVQHALLLDNRPGPPPRLITVVAHNSGRGGGEITHLWFQPVTSRSGGLFFGGRTTATSGKSLTPTSFVGSQAVPCPINAGSSVTWHLDRDSVHKAAAGNGFRHLRAVLALGNGREVHSKPFEVSGGYHEAGNG